MSAIVLRGDARSLPLPDASVDLIVTSPPYWMLRSYRDGGEHYAGQIGSEPTAAEFVKALVACTREMARVLKPSGSMFVNLGDKYSDRGHGPHPGSGTSRATQATLLRQTRGPLEKSLLGLPWRYALACMDDLGLILRRDIVWHKVNPLPESADDRCATRHEYLFHWVKQPRYYAAVDEIREPHTMRPQRRPNGHKTRQQLGVLPAQTFSTSQRDEKGVDGHPLGRAPGSVWVWDIPSQPLVVPAHVGLKHHAAFPMELPRRCILGWSPPAICLDCGEGRFPVTKVANVEDRKGRKQRIIDLALDAAHGPDGRGGERWRQTVAIIGYACPCCPSTYHPATEDAGPWTEYHVEAWTPPTSRPALVVDPFGGTGTTTLVADVLGRDAITFDLSGDYCRLAEWRINDPGERARARGLPKPPPPPTGMDTLFDVDASA